MCMSDGAKRKWVWIDDVIVSWEEVTSGGVFAPVFVFICLVNTFQCWVVNRGQVELFQRDSLEIEKQTVSAVRASALLSR